MPNSPRAAWGAAVGVHVFTALGAGIGLLALLSAVDKHWPAMFAWLALALVVDAADGALARHYRVRENAPRWSGDTLDLVVDILTWVFVPTYAMVTGDIFPAVLAIPIGLAIVITSVIYFADTKMKAGDNFFMGFPGAWNVVAFFLFLIKPSPILAAVLAVGLCILTFVPVPFVHPFRVDRGRAVTALLLVAGGVLALYALWLGLTPPAWVTITLCLICLYFLFAGLLRRN
ncbi:phosphatidylcholine synthase [Variibacter gotjawalensis]|uniref:Phosphatidylcholine synthase n=1 Tax=Variibacter gotjawalensis TaxID=1333996 RepID=A0A0S3PXI0_9BRAD|nr:phosphatidylcholine synthase [Variibacter gotjawalensis]NIK46462.1 phosphatidylcholine synthase [Variibacter gotjawalensis]RZS48372.1 CDP-diacylglycerol-choline O-phosphatidyltransferase [Variibacter gotjawalensis]BAT60630.1 phosphatidylcholine synthase [Variibacter gotjawalensis]